MYLQLPIAQFLLAPNDNLRVVPAQDRIERAHAFRDLIARTLSIALSILTRSNAHILQSTTTTAVRAELPRGAIVVVVVVSATGSKVAAPSNGEVEPSIALVAGVFDWGYSLIKVAHDSVGADLCSAASVARANTCAVIFFDDEEAALNACSKQREW